MARTKTRALVALAAVLLLAAPHPAAGVGARTGGSGSGKSTTFITYPWRFAHLSDTHVKWGFGGTSQYPNSLALRAVTDTLNYLRTHGGMDFCLLTGDWAGGHTTVAHQAQIDSLYAALINRATFPILPVMGNHEAIEADTLLGRNPFQQAQDRFQQWFQGRNYYTFKWKNVQWIALQNNVNYDITSDTDYGVDAPTYGGSVPGRDWDGIHAKTGAERKWLAATLAARDRSDWLLIGMHRPTYGSNLNNATRHNYNAGRGERFIKQVEDSLRSDERGIVFCGDQHIPVWLTKAIRDSSIASATGKGLYHSIVASGSGAREADTTEVFGGAGLQAFLYQDLDGAGNSLRNYGRTTGKWADTLSAVGFKGLTYQFTWSLCTVYGDQIQIEYFMTFMPLDAGNAQYRGAWKHRRIGSYTLYRDMAQEPGAVEVFDNSPPAAVSNLSATSVTGTGLTLNWTSPGDDGTTGTATSYEIRYSTSPYILAAFSSGTVVGFPPSPAVAGTAQTKAVTGLSPSTEYFFALRTTDDAGNVSPLSNGLNVFTTAAADVTPPAAVGNLSVSSPAPTSLTVSWTSPGDDGSTGTANAYDLRRSTSSINSGNFSSATQVSGMPGPAVAGTAQSKVVTGLLEGTTYYFALKTQDEVPNISAISNVVSGTTLDGTAPAAVADLAVTGTTASTVSLSWTSPGDDGSTGTATSYDLRYSLSSINSGNFSGASQATGEPAPAVAGTGQTFTLTGLTPSTTYYICLKTVDEASNASAVSNVPTGATIALDTTPPAAVANLSTGSRSSSGLTLSWTSPGDDGNTGTATTYDLRYATAPTPVTERVQVVANGTFSPANSALCFGNFAQAVPSYTPSASAALLSGQAHPQFHFIPSATNAYAARLSAICGATYQWSTANNVFDIATIPVTDANGSYGTPTAAAVFAGNLASRAFTGGTVYANLSTGSTVSYPGGTLAALGSAVVWGSGPLADGAGQFPRRGGLYWGNLTVSAMDTLATWSDIVLNDANANGPTDGKPGIPVTPKARMMALRKRAPGALVGLSVNMLNVFVDASHNPSAYFPMQIRMYHKANAYGAWIMDGGSPYERVLPWGRVRFFDITNNSWRIWFAAQIDSVLEAGGFDYLFGDETRSDIRDLRNGTNSYPSSASDLPDGTNTIWTAAQVDLFTRVQAGIGAASQVSGEPAPAVAGTGQSKAVSGLVAGTRYWFSLRTADELGNVSALSNAPSDTTSAGTSTYPVQRSFVTYDGGSDMSGGLRTALAAYAPKYIDSPRANDAAWFNTNAPGTYALMYNSLSDDYCLSHGGSDTTEYHWKKVNAVANGCADSEEPYLHFWNDTILNVGGTDMLIKGWGGPQGTATSKAEARVYVYYSDKSRLFCNFSTAGARATHRKWLTTQQLTSNYDGFWFDNAFSRYINTSTPAPYMSYPGTSGSGGTFTAGTYYHTITATTSLGETCKSQYYPISVGTNGTINLSWSAYSGATGYKVYRSTNGDFTTGSLLVATLGSGTTTYTDTGTATTTGNIQQGRILEDTSAHCYLGTTAFFNWNWFSSEGLFLKEFRQGVAAGTYAAELGGNNCKIAINVANVPQADDSNWNYDLITFGNPGNPTDHPADCIFTEFEYNPCRYWGQDYPNTLYAKNKAASDAGVDLWWTGFASGIGAPTGTPSDTTAGVSSGTGTYTASEWLQNGLAMYWVSRTDRTYLQGWAGTDNSTWTPTSSQYQLWNFKAGWDTDLGRPLTGSTGVPYLLVSGTDAKGKGYKVWAREFDNGLAIVRMRGSYNEDIDAGTAVTVTLPAGGPWKPCLINGTVAASGVTTITVRNGQGWIFKK